MAIWYPGFGHPQFSGHLPLYYKTQSQILTKCQCFFTQNCGSKSKYGITEKFYSQAFMGAKSWWCQIGWLGATISVFDCSWWTFNVQCYQILQTLDCVLIRRCRKIHMDLLHTIMSKICLSFKYLCQVQVPIKICHALHYAFFATTVSSFTEECYIANTFKCVHFVNILQSI